ncbi:unnamed protein product [Ilex paraguariensis]|uniref:Uncharacterized protein n=1 Tax=Ilex paraguariensis TaxID=185542 RepID=A0ABC8S9Q7_9AQUA
MIRLNRVCEYAASSKEEWEEQCKLWPTSYHPPTYNIDGITGFNEEDAQLVFTFMKFAIDLAKSVADQSTSFWYTSWSCFVKVDWEEVLSVMPSEASLNLKSTFHVGRIMKTPHLSMVNSQNQFLNHSVLIPGI